MQFILCCMPLNYKNMRIDLKKNLQLPDHLYERLESVLEESNKAENVVPYIFGEFKMYELEKVTQILLETIQDLELHKATTVGLHATDRPDLVDDKHNVLFEIK